MKKDLSENWKIYKEKCEEIEKLLDEGRKLREEIDKKIEKTDLGLHY